MAIQSVSNANSINFRGKNIENKKTTNDSSLNTDKNGNKKLMLALAGLGAIAIAGIALYKGGKKGVDAAAQTAEETLEKTGNPIKDLVKKSDLPFDEKKVTIVKPDGKIFAVKETTAKYSGEYKGQDVIVEHKRIHSENLYEASHNFAFIRDEKTNELVKIKPVTQEGVERPLMSTTDNAVKVKTTEQALDKNGNNVYKTLINGELKSVSKTVINSDGSKTITVDYPGDYSLIPYKKTINIYPDGSKTVETVRR